MEEWYCYVPRVLWAAGLYFCQADERVSAANSIFWSQSISSLHRDNIFASLVLKRLRSSRQRAAAATHAAPVQLAVPNAVAATAAIKTNATKKKARRRGRALRRPRGLRVEDGDGAAGARAHPAAGR